MIAGKVLRQIKHVWSFRMQFKIFARGNGTPFELS